MMIAGASLLLVLPFTSLHNYAHALSRVGEVFDHDSYNIFGLIVQAGASDSVARAGSVVVGVVLLAAVWRYQSFALAVGAALVLSPISWLDYFALAALPLAVVRPRLSAIWFLPLVTWGLEGAGMDIGDVPSTVRLLLVFAVVLGVAFKAERDAGEAPRRRSHDRGDSPRARAPRARGGAVDGARHRSRHLRGPGPVGARLPRRGLSAGRGDRRRP